MQMVPWSQRLAGPMDLSTRSPFVGVWRLPALVYCRLNSLRFGVSFCRGLCNAQVIQKISTGYGHTGCYSTIHRTRPSFSEAFRSRT